MRPINQKVKNNSFPSTLSERHILLADEMHHSDVLHTCRREDDAMVARGAVTKRDPDGVSGSARTDCDEAQCCTRCNSLPVMKRCNGSCRCTVVTKRWDESPAEIVRSS
jgi:hypothetical protein